MWEPELYVTHIRRLIPLHYPTIPRKGIVGHREVPRSWLFGTSNENATRLKEGRVGHPREGSFEMKKRGVGHKLIRYRFLLASSASYAA
jgi:hypothetical protein